MAQYTVTIKTLIENDFDFGLKSYDIFDEKYRPILNKNILNYYLENEIGFETPELFKIFLNNKMQLIMPYYNILYHNLEKTKGNLFSNIHMEETVTGETSTNASSNNQIEQNMESERTNDNKNIYLDTPQGQLYKQDLDDDTVYATNYTQDKGIENTTTDNNTSSNQSMNEQRNDSTFRVIDGNNGKYSNLELNIMLEKDLKNIDMLIINELSDLFMQIY